jgi:type IV pilus assembly protein PilW
MLLTATNPAALPRRQAGMSLVELMVAALIGLLGMLVVFQVFALVEGNRRTTTSGSDAQENGVFALYSLERELRQAGWGINASAALNCNVQAYDRVQGGDLGNYTLAPVVITQGPANGSDTVEVNYGSSPLTVASTAVFQNMVNATDAYVVANRFGFNLNDAILVVEAGQPCSLAQVSGLPAAPSSNSILHASGGAYRYNKPGVWGLTYTTNAIVLNLGPAPVRNIYSIDANNNLVVQPFLSSPAQQAVVQQIVQMKAQYGKDNGVNNGTASCGACMANDGVVDSFDAVTPASTAAWQQVLAVRVGLVARSAQPERPNGGGGCDATTAAPTWSGGVFDLSANPNWQCYRYKVFETTVPVRNQVWFQG